MEFWQQLDFRRQLSYTPTICRLHSTDLLLDPASQAALIAEGIMSQMSASKVTKSKFSASEMKKVFEYLGFAPSFLKDWNADQALASFSSYIDNPSGNESDCQDYFTNFISQCKTSSTAKEWSDMFKTGTEIMGAAKDTIELLSDYYTYRSVTYNDIASFVAAFEKSSSLVLRTAATYLRAMTSSSLSLVLYLASGYCFGEYVKKGISKGIYEAAINSLPVGWRVAVKYGIKAGKLVNNLAFNTKATLQKAYELDIVAQQTEEAYNLLEEKYEAFANEPNEETYDQLVIAKNAYYSMIELEMNKFNAFGEANEKGVFAKAQQAAKGDSFSSLNVSAHMFIYKHSLDSALYKCFDAWVGPLLINN